MLQIDITNKIFDLDKTIASGQVFGWQKQNIDDKTYFIGFINNKLVGINQENNTLNCEGEITEEEILDYFDLQNVAKYDVVINLATTSYERKVVNNARGIHILHQPFIEMVITMLITPRNKIENTELIRERLCTKYGEEAILTIGSTTISKFSFPTSKVIYNLEEEDYLELGTGFRAPNLSYASSYLMFHSDFEEELKNSDEFSIIAKLCEIKGIGDKVANCVALFSLQQYDRFPIDVHIERIIEREYGGISPALKFSPYAGIMQQYMYYNEAIMNR